MKKNNKTPSIIIVSYNTKDILRNCLSSIYIHGKDMSPEIIVVDNASSDGSAEMVEKEFPDVILLTNANNEGFSKANNIGVGKSTGEYVLFLNSDTEIKSNSLQELLTVMEENPQVGAATCKVLLPNGKLDDACHRGFPTPWNSFCHFTALSKLFPKSELFGGYSLTYLDTNLPHEIDACAGAFMLVRRKAGEDAGWWDEDYFWYGDDLDFCYRLKQLGWKVYYYPFVSILHYKGVSGGIKEISKELTLATKETKRMATKARFDAMRIFYKKHYEKNNPYVLNITVRLAITILKKISSHPL